MLLGKEIWHTTSTARTTVPLPNLPAYFAARVAMSTTRDQEIERLLYDNARGMINDKLSFALKNMLDTADSDRGRSNQAGTIALAVGCVESSMTHRVKWRERHRHGSAREPFETRCLFDSRDSKSPV